MHDAKKILQSMTNEELATVSYAQKLVIECLHAFQHSDVPPLVAIAMSAAVTQIVTTRQGPGEAAERDRAWLLGAAMGELLLAESVQLFEKMTAPIDDSSYSKSDRARAARLAKAALNKITGDMK